VGDLAAHTMVAAGSGASPRLAYSGLTPRA
jgi:hypothetical protein